MADTDTSDDVTTDPVHGKDKKSKQQRMLIIIGVVGLILTYILLRRNASTSGQAQATTGTDQALAQYEQQNAADLSGLQAELQTLQGQVAGINPVMGSGDGNVVGTTPTPASTSTTTGLPTVASFAGEQFQGSGYSSASIGQNDIEGLSGQMFGYLPNQQAVETAQAAGTQLYYQPTQGNFQAIGPQGLGAGWANTPIYEAV